jgi:hypothetical protein
MNAHLSKILVAAELGGNVGLVRQLAAQAVDAQVDAIALVGSLACRSEAPKVYGELLKAIASTRLPVFYIPGPDDAPFSEFLREAANFEIVLPNIRGVHSTFAVGPGHVAFVGIGGDIVDEPECARDETERLRYPGWEVEYRFKFLKELKDYEKIFLFTTRPEHKGLNENGSAALAEIVKTYNPRLVLVGGSEHHSFTLGISSVVCPGSLIHGHFSLIDFGSGEEKPGFLRGFLRAA